MKIRQKTVQRIMKNRPLLLGLAAIVLLTASTAELYSASFDEEKTETADGRKFIFPRDALGEGPVIFALAMPQDRKNGTQQQKELMEWQQYFNENPDILGDVPVYHFPVLAGVPFFAKGPIKGALAKYYAEAVAPGNLGVLFVSDIETFTTNAEITLDDQSTLVVVASDGTIQGYLKGALTPEKVRRLQALIP
jgi:hypothetical protein